MARHHLAAALAALSLPAIAVPVAASPPPVAAAAPVADAPPADAPVAEAPAEAPAALPSPGPVCGIRVVRAPADLREQVEGQLEADGTACQGALDVWLVPSSGGIYVQARDRAGRVRERQVPDAAIAATLIASWVEIDAAAPLWAPAADAAPVEPPPAIAAAPEVAAAPSVAPPSRAMAPAQAGTAPVVVARAPAPRGSRTVGVSAMAVITGSEMAGGGVRVDLDVLRWRRFDLGVALQASSLEGDGSMRQHRNDVEVWVTEDRRDSGDALLTLGYTLDVGRLRLRPQVALGAGFAEHDMTVYPSYGAYQTSPNSIGVRAEAALAVAWPLGRTWWIEAQAGTGVATYEEPDETFDQAPLWLDGVNSALIGLRFTP